MKLQKLMLKSVIAVFLMTTVFATPAFARKLRMSNWFPHTAPQMKDVFVPWTKKIAKVTDGRVKIRILKKTVGSVPAQLDVAASGQVDIAFGNQSYSPGRFKQYAFVELPGAGNASEHTSVAYWRVYNRYFGEKSELGDVKLLALFTHGPGQLFTAKHQITSLTSNRGVKVRGGGLAATRVVDALGMTSIQAPFSKAAEMMSNGVVDGIMLDRSIVPLVGFTKYLSHRFTVDGGLFNVSYFVVMNKKTWNSFSKKDQQAIEAVSGETFSRDMGRVWDKMGRSADRVFEKAGMTTTVAAGKLDRELKRAFLKYENQWINSIRDTGVDGRQVIDAYRAEVRSLSGQ